MTLYRVIHFLPKQGVYDSFNELELLFTCAMPVSAVSDDSNVVVRRVVSAMGTDCFAGELLKKSVRCRLADRLFTTAEHNLLIVVPHSLQAYIQGRFTVLAGKLP